MKTQNLYPLSYWERESLLTAQDLVVVGAGIVGLTAATLYAEKFPGQKVLVLERGWFPSGATSRNAGFACFGSIGELLDDLTKEPEDAVFERFERRFQGLESLQKRMKLHDIGYENCGNFEIFETADAFNTAKREIGFFNTWAEKSSGERDVFFITEKGGMPAIGNRLEGVLDSGKLVKALLQKATETGVEVRFNAPVDEIRGNEVVSHGLAIPARQILVASNGFAGELVPSLEVTPARGWVMVTFPIPDLVWKGGFHFNKGYVYFRHLPGNRLLLGGARHLDITGEQTTEFGKNPIIAAYLKEFADSFLGLRGTWKEDISWSGIMGFPKTKTPVIQRNGNLTLACGLGGIGVAVGTDVAASAVQLLD